MIKIPIGRNLNLVAEQSEDENFEREIYLGLFDDNNNWVQDLAVVRQKYEFDALESDRVRYIDGKYQVLVYADKDSEDYTHKFDIEETEYYQLYETEVAEWKKKFLEK